jgi:hypothetical protein
MTATLGINTCFSSAWRRHVSVNRSSIQIALDGKSPSYTSCSSCGKTVYYDCGLDAFKCWLCGGTVRVK